MPAEPAKLATNWQSYSSLGYCQCPLYCSTSTAERIEEANRAGERGQLSIATAALIATVLKGPVG